MKIDSEQLRQHLQRGLQPLYTVHGEETLLALEAADTIRAHARHQGFTEREILTVEAGFDWSRLRHAAASLSLFGSKRLLELRVPTGKPGSQGAEAIGAFAADLPPDTITLVSLPKLDRMQLAAAWFEALEEAGVTVAVQPVPMARLPQWLSGRLAQQGQQADPETLAFLAEMVEGNLLAAQQEVRKLALLYPRGRVSFQEVEAAVVDVARYDVFKLGEALLLGDRARLLRMLDGLRGEGIAPPLVLWAIVEEIRALVRVFTAMKSGKSLQTALREARVWGARADLLPKALPGVSAEELEDAMRRAAQIDRMIKGLAPGDAWSALRELALRVAPGASPARRAQATSTQRSSEESR